MYRIKPVTQQDIPTIGSLIQHTIKTCYPLIYPPKVIRFFLDYHNEGELTARCTKGSMVKLETHEGICATGYLHNKELGGVYVHPSFQKHGYGKAIVLHLLRVARMNNQPLVWLDATPTSLPFYRNLSFIIVSPMIMWVENESLAYYKMQKELV